MKISLTLRVLLLWCELRLRLAVEVAQERDELFRRLKRRVFRVLLENGEVAAIELLKEETRDYRDAARERIKKWLKWVLEAVKWGLRIFGISG